MAFLTLFLLLVTFASNPIQADGSRPSYPCEPIPEIRQVLNSLPSMTEYRIPFDERLRPLLALMGKYPKDLFVHLRYQDLFRKYLHLHEEFERAFAMYRSRPDDPLFRYLEARLTGSFNANRAEEMFNDLLVRNPEFPWTHLGIAELTDRPGSRDARKAESHIRSFLAACPSSVQGYALLRTAEDPQLIRIGAVRLRALLEARTDLWTLPHWRSLWDLEFRAAPKSDQAAVRDRVLKDAARLQELSLPPTKEEYTLLQYAADLPKEWSVLDSFEKRILERFAASPLAVTVERTRWSRAHLRPGSAAQPEERSVYAASEKARQEELRRRWPEDPDVALDRFLAMRNEPSLALDEKLAIVDGYASMRHRFPDVYWSSIPLEIDLAGFYVRWHVRLDRVPAMVQNGLRDAQWESKYQQDPSMFPEEVRKNLLDMTQLPVVQANLRGQLAMADLYLLQKNLDQARDTIRTGLASLNRPSPGGGTPAADRDVESRRRSWLPREARLAELEGDPQQALALYRQYLKPIAKTLAGTSGYRLVAEEELNLVAEIKKFYLGHGGKEESWLEWIASAPALGVPKMVPDALEFNVMLPRFEALDLNGKNWRTADLMGKTTFVDVWATWCGPCRAAHPEIQKLYDAIKDRKDIQVLSFSRDENSYFAESYMKEQKYTFPAIVSKDLVDRLFPAAALPMYWVIDPQGRRSSLYARVIRSGAILADLEKTAHGK